VSRNLALSACMLAAVGALTASRPADVAAKPPSNVPGAEPYQTSVIGTIASWNNGGGGTSTDPIPADRRLVIEYVTVSATVQADAKPSVAINGLVGGAGIGFLVPLWLESGTSVGDTYRGAQLLRVYVDGNGINGPSIQCVRDVAGPSAASCQATVSGYLIGK
jgi:hypothetical protein